MMLTPENLTIAITVYDRRSYLAQAIQSALDQASKPKVIVVEDCGPDAGLREFVAAKFGDRITYHRNSVRRGLFDNWNACIELCRTPWLSILHDDDFLEPEWSSQMTRLMEAKPGRSLYYGNCNSVDARGVQLAGSPPSSEGGPEFDDMDVAAAAWFNPVWFPGQVFNPEHARELGGFQAGSLFCGDWEMWFKLAVRGGASRVNRPIANVRQHAQWGRGTTKVIRNGRQYALENVQRKRNLALLRSVGKSAGFDRRRVYQQAPLSRQFLLGNAAGFSDRLLSYNARLLQISRPPGLSYRGFQLLAGSFGPRFLRLASRTWLALRKGA